MSSFTPINRQPQQSQSSYLSFNDMLNPVSEQIQSTSSSSAMAQPTTKKYLCAVEGCGKGYGSTSRLRRHTKSIHENITYSCREVGCGKSYNRLENLNRHIQTNHIGARYYCPAEGCEKNYSDPSSVNTHVKTKH